MDILADGTYEMGMLRLLCGTNHGQTEVRLTFYEYKLLTELRSATQVSVVLVAESKNASQRSRARGRTR